MDVAKVASVAILGGGRWARAVAGTLAKNHDRVGRIWQYRPHRDKDGRPGQGPEQAPAGDRSVPIEPIGDLNGLGEADLILLALPARDVRQLLRAAGGALHGGHLLVHAVGSLEPGAAELTRISDVVLQETPVRRVGALAGPALALDLEEGRPAALLCGSRFDEVTAALSRVLVSPALKVYTTRDLLGVELSRAMVAIVALAAGVGRTLDLGTAARAILVARGAAEMARLGAALGASERTFFGLAGIGELVVATEGRGSADFELGTLLGKGMKLADAERQVGRICDGPTMVHEAYRLAQRHGVRMTLTTALHRWLGSERSTSQALRDLFAGDDRGE